MAGLEIQLKQLQVLSKLPFTRIFVLTFCAQAEAPT